ncbi:MAG: hypothetical protein P4L74_06730 [Candidatus Doudnabacteria bacterium]|nr:hypothetical protein [Candidatus Doudnabacteria bacterium]
MDKLKYIIWLTGASGVGKTTLLFNLKEKYFGKGNWEKQHWGHDPLINL